MRPEILYPLFAPLSTIAGIGPRMLAKFRQLAGERVIDLCWHLPNGLIDRRFSPPVNEAPDGAVVTLSLTIGGHRAGRGRRSPYRIACHDDSGEIDLVFFHPRGDYLARTYPEGARRIVSGTVERYEGRLQMTHPDYVFAPDKAGEMPAIEPIYPLTAGLSLKQVVRAVSGAVARAPDLPEWQDAAWHSRQDWPGWREALLAVHGPQSGADLEPDAPARARLAYDELLANQLALALMRARMRRRKGRAIIGRGQGEGRGEGLRDKVLAALPFTLTASQQQTLAEIDSDMAAPQRMIRLLQGDVGSGKTIVAFLAMLNALEAGAQAAMVAPTEILARQHYESLQALAEAAGVRLARLTGRDKGKKRGALLDSLADGTTRVIVGTHALFEDDVRFDDLALVVIDEQHRFGVHQRLTMTKKGRAPVDLLVMTATPIPRTLMLTAYGDMDISRLLEKPPGRQPVDTRSFPLDRLGSVEQAVGRALGSGARAYWVCPLIEESESLDVAAAEQRFEQLKKLFGDRVGLVHGRMTAGARDAAMARFASGETGLLVATTVIEVGVDVPEATIMVVEHAERFGLAQLHQLRGRIGRGAQASWCFLLYGRPLGEVARQRLAILRDTDDGFRIAEEDLRLRGAGEVLGTRQSGLPDFRLADLEAHGELLAAARDDAALTVSRDPTLKTPRGAALRVLLYLFEREAAIRTLAAG